MNRPPVWCLLTEAGLLNVCSPADYERLREEFDLTLNPGPDPVPYEQLVAGIAPYSGLITGWGASPRLEADFYEAAVNLRVIAHWAGTVRGLVAPGTIERYLRPRGLVMFSARAAIAENVAESIVGLLIATSRRWFEQVEYFRQTGGWGAPHLAGVHQHLLGATLGVLGASQVGRRVLRLLQGWDLTKLLYDPYVSPEEAATLGAEQVDLEELLRRSDHVAVCLPVTDETRGLLTAERLRLLPDGAVLVNCARAAVMDLEAVIAEAASGRLIVGLDVTDPQEPPPADSPLRDLPNVCVTPHVAGAGRYGYQLIGHSGLQALRDALAGRPVQGAVDWDHFELLG